MADSKQRMDALRIMILIMVLIAVYSTLTHSEADALIVLIGSIAFIVVVPKSAELYEEDPYRDYIKAASSEMGQKLPLPDWATIKTRSFQPLSFKTDKVDGGWVHIYQTYSCKCGAEDYTVAIPYPISKELDASKTNIRGYWDHKREPRSPSQIRRILTQMGVKDDKALWEETKKIYDSLLFGRKRHRSFLKKEKETTPDKEGAK